MTDKEKLMRIVDNADAEDIGIIIDTFIYFLSELPEERAELMLHLLTGYQ